MNLAVALQVLRGTFAASPMRILLTLACVALGVALAGAVHTIHASALAEIDQAAHAISGSAELEVRGPRSGFDDRIFEAIAALPGVRVASPVVEVEAALADGPGSVRVLGIDPFRALQLQPAFAAGGASLPESSRITATAQAWLSPAAAARLALARGAVLRLVAGNGVAELEVAGVLDGLAGAGDVVVVDIAAAQQVFDRIGLLTRIEIGVRPGASMAQLSRAIEANLPAGVLLGRAAQLAGRAASITRAYRVNLDALALVALGSGAFLVFSTLALQAARRRQELALLRALGVTRRGITALIAFEGVALGLAGALAGTLLGLAASRLLLRGAGADLGAGFFAGQGNVFAPDAWVLAGIATVAITMSTLGAHWAGREVSRMEVTEGLRDRAADLPAPARGGLVPALALAALGVPLLFLPPLAGLPLGGYGAIALWLAAAVLAVGPACALLLRTRAWPRDPLAELALSQVRDLPGHLAGSIAGIVVSASLCVAMAIMVFSFRHSLEAWLAGVVGADAYVRSSTAGDSATFRLEDQARVAAVPGVARIEALRYDRLALDGGSPLTLVARPIDAAILAGFRADPPGLPARGGAVPVWITEAAADLHGWRTGELVSLPLAGRTLEVRVAGVVRDYARSWGAILIGIDDYRSATADTRANDLALHLVPGARIEPVTAAVRAALGNRPGLAIDDAAGIKRRSIAIFDRTFAVTYALEAIAIAISLAGVTSSFAALAWARRREFAVLRFLGLRRRDVLRLLAFEGAAAGSVGATIGLVAGIAISLVLVHVVNRQSFHWSMELHWPVAAIAAFVAGLVAACALGARASGAFAVRDEAVRAVKNDA